MGEATGCERSLGESYTMTMEIRQDPMRKCQREQADPKRQLDRDDGCLSGTLGEQMTH